MHAYLKHAHAHVCRCASGTQAMAGIEPERLVCRGGAWPPPTLVCKKLCADYIAPPNSLVRGSGLKEGDVRDVKCETGFTNMAIEGDIDIGEEGNEIKDLLRTVCKVEYD